LAQHPHLDPSPFLLPAGPVGVLLIHGFTGAPTEMRLIGDYLHGAGYTVSGPLLPGHGTRVEDMNRYRWTDWLREAEQSYEALRVRCEQVFVAGLSLGSLLAVHLAAKTPAPQGIVLYSPPAFLPDRRAYLAPLVKRIAPVISARSPNDLTDPEAYRRLWCYDQKPMGALHELIKIIRESRRLLPSLRCPLLVAYSTGDRQIGRGSGQYVYEHAGSPDKERIELHNSGHALTVDSEWRAVADATARFIARNSSRR
jgi:carboxylesterase